VRSSIFLVGLALGLFLLQGCAIKLGAANLASAPGAFSVPPADAQQIDNIQNLSNWKPCTGSCSACPANDPSCAGVNANYVTTVQQVTPPSSLPVAVGGLAGLFELDSGPSYATALWGKSISPSGSFTHFIWDFYVYVDTSAIQNLEFDLYTVVGGHKYMMGSQCNYNKGNWQGWNESTQHWINSSAPCPKLTPNVWHHIVKEQSIDPQSTTFSYEGLQIDDAIYSMNLGGLLSASSNWGSVVGVQVQIDSDKAGDGVREYIENMTVTMW